MTPTWRTASDLQHTRISEKQNDLLLTFKQIDWQTLRIEADCLTDSAVSGKTTPLRLITNQSKIRISVKKKYSGRLSIFMGWISKKPNFVKFDSLIIPYSINVLMASIYKVHTIAFM